MIANGPCFEFRLLLRGLDLHNEDQVDSLLSAFDGGASVSGTTTDLVAVLVTASGSNPLTVVDEAVARVRSSAPAATVVGLDQELVGISDIAEMAATSRETIRLYANGARRGGEFPAPVGVIGEGVRVWRWSDVDAWMRQNTDFDFPTQPLPSWATDFANAKLTTPRGARPRKSKVARKQPRSSSPRLPSRRVLKRAAG